MEFPSISIGDFFDLTFSLKTAFGDGLIAFSGNTSQVCCSPCSQAPVPSTFCTLGNSTHVSSAFKIGWAVEAGM